MTFFKLSLFFFLTVIIVDRVSSIPFDSRLFGSVLDLRSSNGSSSANTEMTIFRLPKDLVPESYVIHLEPDLMNADFNGHVAIAVKVYESTRVITLNAKYITVSNATNSINVTRLGARRAESIPIQKYEMDTVNEQMNIYLTKPLVLNFRYLVEISYKGELGNDMMGFYRSSYQVDGKTKYLGCTQFEATGARRAFPSFDEPGFKTPFTISITRESYQTAISNMPLKLTDKIISSSKERDVFQESPAMPTYLVGFAVFEFDKISVNNGTFRVWGRENIIKEQGKYIAEIGPRILSTLSNYMGIDYYSMLPKMDLIAVPDFDAGAMENWGMNTYREVYILADPAYTKTSRLEDVVSTVTHEFSHQWFGDFVTPSWWNYLWLNEGFATFFEYFGTHLVEPTWRMEDLFVVEQVQVAFNSDLKHSHAMTSETTTPESIADTFDHIIYNKGGSVLRMIENVVTPKIFRETLRNYLENGQDSGGTVEPSNLWAAFDETLSLNNATGVLPNRANSIFEFTNEWVNKPGFPLVTVQRDYVNKIANFTQARFYTKVSDSLKDNTKWNIPITYTFASEKEFSKDTNLKWLTKQAPLRISVPQNNDWLIVNIKQVGFYRVNYDNENWQKIATQLFERYSAIDVLNRAQILDDAFTLARTDQLDYKLALDLTKYLSRERDFIPWYSVWSHVRLLMRTYADTTFSEDIRSYFESQLQGIFSHIDVQMNEDNMRKIARSNVILWVCHLGNPGCIYHTSNKFKSWIANPKVEDPIAPDLKDAVLCMGIKTGTKEEWDKLWNYYIQSDLATEKNAVLYALGCSTDEDKLYNYLLEIIKPNSPIRTQDHYLVIRAVLGEKPGLHAGMTFLKEQTENLLKAADKDERSGALENLESIIGTVGAGISSDEEHQLFKSVILKFASDDRITETVNRTLGHIEERLHFKSIHEKEIQSWFVQNSPTTEAPPTTLPPTTTKLTTPPVNPPTTSPPHPHVHPTTKPNSANIEVASLLSLGVLLFIQLYFV